MARSDELFDLDQHHVAVAIGEDRFHKLKVPAGFAFQRKPSPAAAVGVNFSGLDRLVERFAVHPGHHENLAVGVVLHDQGNQAGGVKFQLVQLRVHAEFLT